MSIKTLEADLPSPEEQLLAMFTPESRLPTFRDGASYGEHVEAFAALDASAQHHRWAQAAVAACLTRQPGMRGPEATLIQAFCRDVGITERHFRNLSRTYRVWHAILTSGTQAPEGIPAPLDSPLSFTHFRLAAEAADPIAAIVAAHDGGWTIERLAIFVRREGRAKESVKAVAPETLPAPVLVSQRSCMRARGLHLESKDADALVAGLEAAVRARPEFVAALADIAADDAEALRLAALAREMSQRVQAKRERFDREVRKVLLTELEKFRSATTATSTGGQ